MMPAHHADALKKIVEELVPRADKMMPTLGRRLAASLTKHEQAIRTNLRSDIQRAMVFYGRLPSPTEAQTLSAFADEAQAIEADALKALVKRLTSDPRMSIAPFVTGLLEKMKSAILLHGSKRITEPDAATEADLRAVVEGDSAFRALHYFLEAMTPILDEVQPRSMLALRSAS